MLEHMHLSKAPIRVARPSRDLKAAERFYRDGLGLDVLLRLDDDAEGGHALLMLGWPDAAWHLELVGAPEVHADANPTDEDLLVIYAGQEIDGALIERLVAHGGTRVHSPNPYWEEWGITVADPDGYRLVLSSRSWP